MPKKTVKIFSLLVISLLVFSVLITGCLETDPDEERETLVVALPREPESLDVQEIRMESMHHEVIYRSPFTLDLDEEELMIDWVEDIEFENDGTEWTITLPEDVEFPETGNTLDAYAFSASLERYLETSPFASDWKFLEGFPDNPEAGIDVIDETTIKLNWVDFPAYGLVAYASCFAGIVDVEAEEEYDFSERPVTYGPFEFVEWVRGSRITLERNDDFTTNDPRLENQGAPHFEEVEMRYVPEDLTRVEELRTGDVDIITDIPRASVDELDDDEDVSFEVYDYPGMERLQFNNNITPFDDSRVRKAINFAVDREVLANYLHHTEARYSFIAPGQIAHSEDIEEWGRENRDIDLEKAEELLDDAGYPDGFSAELLVPSDEPGPNEIAPILQEQLGEVGVEVEISTHPADYIRSAASDGEHEMALMRWGWAFPQPLLWYFNPEWPDSYAQWRTEEAHEALEYLREGEKEQDPETRREIYEDVQEIFLEEMPAVPLFTQDGVFAYRNDQVEDVEYDTGRRTFFWNDIKPVNNQEDVEQGNLILNNLVVSDAKESLKT